MKVPFKKLDLYHIQTATHISKSVLRNAEEMVYDTKKELRIAAQECRRCFYSGKIGGCAMTSSQCSLCEKDLYFSSTCIDVLCIDCAKTTKLCKHCGGDMELKRRLKIEVK